MKIIPSEEYKYNVQFSESESISRLKVIGKFLVHENKFASPYGRGMGIGFMGSALLDGYTKTEDEKTIVYVKIKINSALSGFLYLILGFCLLGSIISIVQSIIKEQILWEGILGTIGFGVFAYIFYYAMYIMSSSQILADLKKALRIK